MLSPLAGFEQRMGHSYMLFLFFSSHWERQEEQYNVPQKEHSLGWRTNKLQMEQMKSLFTAWVNIFGS
jgi:hypothetical protein